MPPGSNSCVASRKLNFLNIFEGFPHSIDESFHDQRRVISAACLNETPVSNEAAPSTAQQLTLLRPS